MRPLSEQLCAYAEYHRDRRNKLTHIVGVPTVVFSVLLFLGWFRFAPAPLPLTAATLFYLGVLGYYLRLDWVLGVAQAPLSALLLYGADRAAQLPFATSAALFGATFVSGWALQLVGHAFEGRRPALVDNGLQVFNAPLFLTAEVLFLSGWRPQLKRRLQAQGRDRPAGA